MKTPKKPKVQPARLTITLENYAGIKRQEWVGTPQSFKIDWPHDVMNLLGERMTHLIVQPHQISFEATIASPGTCYRANHETKEGE